MVLANISVLIVSMNILAIIATRNERNYIARCIGYLIAQGIKVAVLDNDSTDGTYEEVSKFPRDNVVLVERYPYPGYYDWLGILRRKEQLREELDADWVIHHDCDEIMESPRFGESLADGIRRAARLGYDAVNFDEFVFVPENESVNYDGTNFRRTMRYYYFFEPTPFRLIRAFRNDPAYSNIASGGHRIDTSNIKIYPANFVLRHYICLSWEHARQKYLKRVYSREEVSEMGWHGNRVTINERNLVLPKRDSLETCWPWLPVRLKRDRKRKKHFWEW